jgi:hypothetical protein
MFCSVLAVSRRKHHYNISGILNGLQVGYDKRVRPNYGGKQKQWRLVAATTGARPTVGHRLIVHRALDRHQCDSRADATLAALQISKSTATMALQWRVSMPIGGVRLLGHLDSPPSSQLMSIHVQRERMRRREPRAAPQLRRQPNGNGSSGSRPMINATCRCYRFGAARIDDIRRLGAGTLPHWLFKFLLCNPRSAALNSLAAPVTRC